MKGWSITLVATLAAIHCSCGSPQPQGTTRTLEQITNVPQCSVVKDLERPMLVEWPAVEKARLQTIAASAVVVAWYDDCRLKILDRCTLSGSYDFMETPRGQEGFKIRDKSELFQKLWLGAISLEGEFARGNQLSLDYITVGTRTANVGNVSAAMLGGECERATHIVRQMVVGAFKLSSQTTVGGGGGIGVGLSEVGGIHETEDQVIRSEGDINFCTDNAVSANDNRCQAIVQLVLEPIITPEAVSAPSQHHPVPTRPRSTETESVSHAGHAYPSTQDPVTTNSNAGDNREGDHYAENSTPSILGGKPGATWTDPDSGLVWQAKAAKQRMNWADAAAHCAALSDGARSGWRLPNLRELASSISGCTKCSGSLPLACEGCTVGGRCYRAKPLKGGCARYWSSSSSTNGTYTAWGVDFSSGGVDYFSKTDAMYVRCVK